MEEGRGVGEEVRESGETGSMHEGKGEADIVREREGEEGEEGQVDEGSEKERSVEE